MLMIFMTRLVSVLIPIVSGADFSLFSLSLWERAGERVLATSSVATFPNSSPKGGEEKHHVSTKPLFINRHPSIRDSPRPGAVALKFSLLNRVDTLVRQRIAGLNAEVFHVPKCKCRHVCAVLGPQEIELSSLHVIEHKRRTRVILQVTNLNIIHSQPF